MLSDHPAALSAGRTGVPVRARAAPWRREPQCGLDASLEAGARAELGHEGGDAALHGAVAGPNGDEPRVPVSGTALWLRLPEVPNSRRR
jgi:hypothetical protein